MSSLTTAGYANPLLKTPERPLPGRIGIVGAGTIGPDIGYYLKSSIPGLTLCLVDVRQEALDMAVERFHGYARKGLTKGKLTEAQAAEVTKDLVPTLAYEDLTDCDWVIEAATENLDLKKRIFAQIESIVKPDALITSNTSSIPASRMFDGLEHPGRATVTHFFAPAYQNPAVEVIRWAKSDTETVEYLRWLFCATGKVPLVTDDVLCFMLDRIFDNWCNDAALLLEHATASEIDSVANELVHAGPFFVLNLARGNPIIVETNTLQMEEGEHYRPAEIFRSVDTWTTLSPRQRIEVPVDRAATIRDRLRGVLFSQSVDVVDRDIGTAADLELGCSLALGFKSGPFDVMRHLGESEVARVMDRFARDRPGMPQAKHPLATYQAFSRHVLVDDIAGVKVLTIRRPRALNALSDEVNDELLAGIREYEDDPDVAGFVVTGYGPKAFCAGADIGRFPKLLGQTEAAIQYSRDCSRLLVHLDTVKKPVVAALGGMALGGGLELALRCRSMVATRKAWMQFPEVTLGIVPGIGGMVVPYRRWPQAAAVFHDLIRTAKRLGAEEAHELGLLDGLADGYEDLIQLAVDRVKALADAPAPSLDGPVEIPAPEPVEPVAGTLPLSPSIVGLIEKAIVEAAQAPTLGEALEIGYAAFGDAACTPAAAEGIQAFQQRRKADFKKTG